MPSPPGSPVLDRACAVLVTAGLAGCSLSLSGPDPGRPRDRAPECDTGKGLVGLDVVAGSGLVLGGLVAIGQDAGGESAIPIALGGALFLAASRGNSNVNECRRAFGEFQELAVRPAATAATAARSPRRPPIKPPPAKAPPAKAPPIKPPAAEVAREPEPPPAAEPAPAPVAADAWQEFWKELP